MRMLRSWFAGSDHDTVEAAPPVPATPDMRQLTAADLDLSAVPAAARERVVTIQGLLADLHRRAAERGLANADLTELTQIATLYLPRLLHSYAAIPPQHRAEIFRDTGRSASFLLTERLDRIIERLREISKDFARGHLDAFSDNMRFIDLRYGGSTSPFD